MIELVIFAVLYSGLAVALLYRVFKGPTVADRMTAADALDTLTASVLILVSLYTGRGIYLDIAIVIALFGFIGTVFVARYLEGKL